MEISSTIIETIIENINLKKQFWIVLAVCSKKSLLSFLKSGINKALKTRKKLCSINVIFSFSSQFFF